MVQGFVTHLGSFDKDLKVFLEIGLSNIFFQRLRPETGIVIVCLLVRR